MTQEAAPASREPGHAAETPYVGLVPYTEEDAAFFFGREEDKQIVIGNLRGARLTLLYGPSGVGKTSLLQAGVVRDLRAQVRANAAAGRARPPFAVCTFNSWREEPVRALREALRAAAVEALGEDDLPSTQPDDTLVESLRRWTPRVRGFLIVLDQFEEYFLYHEHEDADAFADQLAQVVHDPRLRANVLLSIREDALAKLDRFEDHLPRLFANHLRVEPLRPESARRAIEGPIREWNRSLPDEMHYTLEPALVDAVVQAATATRGAVADGDGLPIMASTAIEAPFLQLVMERLWRATVDDDERVLTLERLEQLGGAEQIVSNHLQVALGTLTVDEQRVAADVFRFLVTRAKTKIAQPASDLAEWTTRPEAEVAPVLQKLTAGESGRILRAVSTPADGATETSYELFHDILAEPILDWRRTHDEESARGAARKRYLRIAGVAAALAAVFAALGVWALVERGQAERATRSASSLALAAAANDELETHPALSLLLGLEATHLGDSAQVRSSMLSALEAAREAGWKLILRGHTEDVLGIAFSSDGGTIASVGQDGTLRLWDVRTQKPIGRPLRGHEGAVFSVALGPHGIVATGGGDGTVVLWDARSGEQLRALRGHRDWVRAVELSGDGRTLASASADGTIRLWDVRTGRPLDPPLRGHDGNVLALDFSPDARVLASGGADGTVRLWNVATRTQLGDALLGHTGAVWTVAFGNSGRILASGAADGTVRLWDVVTHAQSGKGLQMFASTGSSREFSVLDVAFDRKDGVVTAVDGFGTVRRWDVATRSLLGQPLRGQRVRPLAAAALTGDLGTVATAGDDTVRLWDLRSRPRLGRALGGGEATTWRVAFTPDGRTLASGGELLRLWDLRAGGASGDVLPGIAGIVTGIAFSPDGGVLASAAGGEVLLWRVDARKRLGSLRGAGNVRSVAFSPDGRMLATGGDGVRFWDADTRMPIRERSRIRAPGVASVAFSPDGGTLASGSDDGAVRLWDAQSGVELDRLGGHAGGVRSVMFSPEGRILASGGEDGAVRIWSVPRRTQLGPALRADVETVWAVAFSPDGRTLATGGADATVRLWDVGSRRPLGRPLVGHTAPVVSVAFSADGRSLASASLDGTVRLWEKILWRARSELRDRVCSLVVGGLTRAEWDDLVPGVAYSRRCAR